MLLLLSGDVELNPGPMIDDQPDIFLLLQWLEPLVDWQPFGILLPGITQWTIKAIEQLEAKHQKLALFTKWLNTDPTATWRDVLNALTEREEINKYLLQTINDQLQVHQCTGGNTDAPTSTVPVVSTVSSSVSVINKPVTSTTSGNPKDILRTHSDTLVHAISVNLYNVTDALYAKELIPQQTKEEMHVLGVTNNEKSSKLVNVIEQQLESSLNPKQYLIDICHVLKNQQHRTLTDIATSILHQLGQSIPDNVSSHTVLPSPVNDISNTPVTNIRDPSVPNDSNGAAVSATQREEIMFNTQEDEEQVSHSLIELHKAFASLMMEVQTAFDERVASNPKVLINLTRWIEAYMNWSDKLTNASLNGTFEIIHPFYDFIDCSLIVDMSEVFLQDFKNIVSELQNYKKKADKLRSSAQVKHLHDSLQTIFEGHIPDTSNMPVILVKLRNPWGGNNIKGLSLLIHNLLPVGHQQSIMKYITILSGSVIVKYSVYGSSADSLIEYTGGKEQFMRLIGIFSLYINGHPVLIEDENMNFTFELALLEAVTAGNNEAVEFLLQLETVNIDHTNEEGKTALMLACERGHEDIVHSLLSAGANVNIQDNKGWTTLMMASKHNHISIIHMLLQANANPHLKTSSGSKVDPNVQNKDGVTALMLASANGHYEVVKLLLEWEADPNINSNKGNTALSLSKTSEISALIDGCMYKKGNIKLEEDDSSVSLQIAVPSLYHITSDISRGSSLGSERTVSSGYLTASNISSPISSFESPETESFRCHTTSNISSKRSSSTSSYSSAISSSTSDSERAESTRHQTASDTKSTSESERVESSGYGTASSISSTRNSPIQPQL
uniref:CARD domain-containing protein n=1 Tax=Amphimedon queenslandica TaxID=400682 RepID=A0A1X7V054_AMPQE